MPDAEKDTTMRVRPDVAAEGRRLARQLAAYADRRVTLSEALGAAFALALANLPAAAEMLDAPTAPPADDGGGAALSDPTAFAKAGK